MKLVLATLGFGLGVGLVLSGCGSSEAAPSTSEPMQTVPRDGGVGAMRDGGASDGGARDAGLLGDAGAPGDGGMRPGTGLGSGSGSGIGSGAPVPPPVPTPRR